MPKSSLQAIDKTRNNPKSDSRPKLYGWAPGSYWCVCAGCGEHFIGDKRALSCADCAYKQPDPVEKPKLLANCELIGRATRVLNQTVEQMDIVNQVKPLIHDMRTALLIREKKPSIELLEAEIERLKEREQDLLETNNRYLERARKAEGVLERNGFNKRPFAA